MKKVLKNILYVLIFFIITSVNPAFATSNSANIPMLVSGLTPIKYVNGGWTTVTKGVEDREWFDYEHGQWANAETQNGDKYVWIPRFTYKIDETNQTISIKWSDGKVDDISDGYLRHPAFYFGEYFGGDPNAVAGDMRLNFGERDGSRNELTGFWIKKELKDTNVDPSIAFKNALNINKEASYGLPQSGTYVHMTKASEWGALAYLTYAKGNFRDDYTTKNITGVNIVTQEEGNQKNYEYVAGISHEGTSSSSYSEILSYEYKKYRDYFRNSIDTYKGYALTETLDFTESDTQIGNNSFLVRGGSLGLFGYTDSSSVSGQNVGYRTTISVITEELTEPISFFDTETSVTAGDFLILGVDFNVTLGEGQTWKFPVDVEDFFVASDAIGGEKVVDMECIYEGSTRWEEKDLNAQVLKLIIQDPYDPTKLSIVEKEDINETSYKAGKYTLVVKVGGTVKKEVDGVLKDIPVFLPLHEEILINGQNSQKKLDAKIVVNKLNLALANDELLKIEKIPNNKVRLNIYDETGSTAIKTYKLTGVPSKDDYSLFEEIDLTGGVITGFDGIREETINLPNPDVVIINKDVTYTPGTGKQVFLKYQGYSVIQEEGKEFLINVSDTAQLVVEGEVWAESTKLNSQLSEGPGNYTREEADYTVNLETPKYRGAYMFSSWESNSSDVEAEDSKDNTTTFTVPSKSSSLDKNLVTIIARYITPTKLEVVNPQTEFFIGDNFTLGDGSIIATYGTEERRVSLSTTGVKITLKDGSGNELELENLPEGIIEVIISFGGQEYKYEIEVIEAKYQLTVGTASIDRGEISGDIRDAKGTIKDTIVINEDILSYSKDTPVGRTITLNANPKGEYVFAGWNITGVENLITKEQITSKDITFTMPSADIIIEAVFSTEHTITFKVKAGQESRGTIEGELTQKVLYGGKTTPVTAIPNDTFGFLKWIDSDNRFVSFDKEYINTYVTEDKEYIAVFDNVWTVNFYNEGTLFKSIQVSDGGNGYISDTPTKYGYVFTGWDQDLSNVTSNIETNAKYVPRINIEENPNYAENTIDAQITGTMIEEGTLEYMISSSPETPKDNYFTYKTDDIFTAMEGNWYNLEEHYRSAQVSSGVDSSEVLTISSNNVTEIVKFDYMLSVSSDSQLGITINGERVVGPDMAISSNWTSFEKEVEVIDGKIKIGISYSQGDGNDISKDFAAIRNLMVAKRWISIPNSYHLLIPVEFEQNYIHVRGTGSDDLTTVYYAVSDVFTATGVILDTYTVTFNSNGGIGSMYPQTFTEGISQELTANEFTRDGYEFIGWAEVPGEVAQYTNKQSYIATENKLLYAVWKEELTEKYVITAISHEGARIKGVYENHICSECGGTDHQCEIINVTIKADNALVTQRN